MSPLAASLSGGTTGLDELAQRLLAVAKQRVPVREQQTVEIEVEQGTGARCEAPA